MNKEEGGHCGVKCATPEKECGIEEFRSSQYEAAIMVLKLKRKNIIIDLFWCLPFVIIFGPLGLITLVSLLFLDMRQFRNSFQSALAFCRCGIWVVAPGSQPYLILKGNVISIDYQERREVPGTTASHIFLRIEAEEGVFSMFFVLTREDNRRLVRVLTLGYPIRRDQGPWFPHGSAH